MPLTALSTHCLPSTAKRCETTRTPGRSRARRSTWSGLGLRLGLGLIAAQHQVRVHAHVGCMHGSRSAIMLGTTTPNY